MKKILSFTLKVFFFLIILLALYYFIQPEPFLGKISLYNFIFPGRERLPFGENPRVAYNFSLYNLNAMFASHEISGVQEQDNSFRVITIGDSSVWGTLLKPEETLAGQLDGKKIKIHDAERKLEVYNLGYPTLSLAKDVLILQRGMAYKPDLILWFTTMESFPNEKQIESPLLAKNSEEFAQLLTSYGEIPSWMPKSSPESFWEKTLFSQRRALMDLIRLQLYGFMWAATGIDQDYPADYPVAQVDFDRDNSFHGVDGIYPNDQMAWELLNVGMRIAGNVPVILINEPILISDGENSDIRYNFYYPRQAYDVWRKDLADRCTEEKWKCLDLWNLLSQSDFTNSAIHYNSEGGQKIVDTILDVLPESLQ